MRRNQLFWGSVLVLVGGLMLASELGVTLPNGNSLMGLFWPLLLIGFGVWVLLSIYVRRTLDTENASIELQGAREARLNLNHGAGEFRLHSGASNGEFLRGSFTGGLDYNTARNGDRLKVKMRPAHDFFALPDFIAKNPLEWDVALNAGVPTAIDLHLGANKSTIDLRDMNITDIKLRSGASDTVMTLPAQGRLNVDCEIGAANLVLIVPDGVAIRARAFMGAGSFHVDRSRFPQDESADFATAQNALDIHVKGGASTIRIK